MAILPTIEGSDIGETVAGAAISETIRGRNGDDLVVANAGDDRIFGGGGSDTVLGNEGDDTLFGGNAADVLNGGRDDDIIYGGSGTDELNGDFGADDLYGGNGVDTFIFDERTAGEANGVDTIYDLAADETIMLTGGLKDGAIIEVSGEIQLVAKDSADNDLLLAIIETTEDISFFSTVTFA